MSVHVGYTVADNTVPQGDSGPSTLRFTQSYTPAKSLQIRRHHLHLPLRLPPQPTARPERPFRGTRMITYTCDQCHGPITSPLRIVVTAHTDRHFCTVACLVAWALVSGYAKLSQIAAAVKDKPPEPIPVTPTLPKPEPEPETKPARLQDSAKHTCEICGRVGSRRYIETPTGWKCSPTATACPGNRTFPPPPTGPAVDLDAPPKPQLPAVPAEVLERRYKAGEQAEKSARASDVTARCTDCGRTWNLTGRVLKAAIDTHEHTKQHIVDVHPQAYAS